MDNYTTQQPPQYRGMQRMVTFSEAVQRGFNNYANFNGRASRSEYWYWYLFTLLVSIVAGVIDQMIGTGIFSILCSLALLIPGLAITFRRLHDIGKAGGYIFLALIPLIGAIILLIWYIKPSEMSENRFGPIPNWING